MKKRILGFLTLSTIVALAFSLLSFPESVDSSRNTPNTRQQNSKKLRERAMERDVEVDGPSGCDVTHVTLDGLNKGSTAIVYGKINSSRSFFDESSPSEAGDYITTEYSIRRAASVKRYNPNHYTGSGLRSPAYNVEYSFEACAERRHR